MKPCFVCWGRNRALGFTAQVTRGSLHSQVWDLFLLFEDQFIELKVLFRSGQPQTKATLTQIQKVFPLTLFPLSFINAGLEEKKKGMGGKSPNCSNLPHVIISKDRPCPWRQSVVSMIPRGTWNVVGCKAHVHPSSPPYFCPPCLPTATLPASLLPPLPASLHSFLSVSSFFPCFLLCSPGWFQTWNPSESPF